MKSVNIKSLKRSKNLRDGIFFACMVLIPTLNFLVLYLGVNLNSILLAFKQYDATSANLKFSGLYNFEKFFSDFNMTFTTPLKNSLVAAIFTIGVNTTLTIIFALYIYHKRFAHNIFKVILFMPSIISSIVMVKIFETFCNSAIPNLAKVIFNIEEMTGLLVNGTTTQWPMIIFFNIWSGFGASLLVYVGGMNNISESVSEAAHIDGANFIQETWYITLPLIYPTIMTYITAGLATVFTNQLGVYSFKGNAAPSNLYTVGYWIYKAVKDAESDISAYPFIATVGIICTVVSVPIVFAIRALMKKLGPSVE